MNTDAGSTQWKTAVAIYVGIFDGNLVISDSTAASGGAASTSITDDPVFPEGLGRRGAPGATFRPKSARTLAPLQSFPAYATVDNGVATFSALVQAR